MSSLIPFISFSLIHRHLLLRHLSEKMYSSVLYCEPVIVVDPLETLDQ